MQVSTTCPYCGVGCGLTVSLADKNQHALPLITADKKHPANYGRVCSKGSALAETLEDKSSPARLICPSVGGQEVNWDTASREIATRIRRSIDVYGPDSVAFYLSGQLLTEDYYVANKLSKGFLATANVDTNSRLCMSSAVAAYKRAFGSDTVPCSYEDLESADLIVLIGSNAAWTHPVLYQRMVAAKQSNPNLKVVLIDPRKTATAEIADLHLAITPSSDNYLFQGLLNFLSVNRYCNNDYIAQHTEGFNEVLDQAAAFDVDSVATICGLDRTALQTFYHWFATIPKTVSVYSQGINQSASGTDKCNAIINCHLATGKLGYAGAGPFSITGQPNAMGGREVGGMANMLAAHMDFTSQNIDTVQRFWAAPNMARQAGLKAVDLFKAVEKGRIKVLWIMATNPAVSLPDSHHVASALSKCETVIVSDVTHTDTSRYADILLPAQAWSEKNGTVTNSERRISRQRNFRQAPGSAKPDWWALSKVAEKLGYQQAFDYQSPAQIFAEHCALSAFENRGQRDFDLSGLLDEDSTLSVECYDSMQPIQWPVTKQRPEGTPRMFADGKFFTSSGKAQFVVSNPNLAIAVKRLENVKAQATSQQELLLNSGRLRDQWHTMTRTGYAPTLTAHDDVAFVQMNPADALTRGLRHNAVATLGNHLGEAQLQVKLSSAVKPGELFAPIHWNRKFASSAIVNAVLPPLTDPVSGQPELKAAAVLIQPMLLKNWARIISRQPLQRLERFEYWCSSLCKSGFISLVGGNDSVDWRAEFTHDKTPESIEYANPLQVSRSVMLCDDGQIEAIIFQHQCASQLPGRVWLASLFEANDIEAAAKQLRGEQGAQDELVCACFGTTRKHLEQAIEQGAKSQQELVTQLGCGSKCGSCRPELKQHLEQ